MKKINTVAILVGLAAICVLVYFLLQRHQNTFSRFEFYGDENSQSKLGIYINSAVSSDSTICAEHGKKILDLGGTAMDAAISVLLCMGIILPHSMGLGGGCSINYFDKTSQKAFEINGRERAPYKATKNMFKGNKTKSQIGGLAVAIPGELAAYKLAHENFGRLNWTKLFDQSIELAENGFKVNQHLAKNLLKYEQAIKSSSLRRVFVNKKTDQVFQLNDVIKRPDLAKTYSLLANALDPVELFYKGEIAKQLIEEINEEGGDVFKKDFEDYQAVKSEAFAYQLPGKYTMYVTNSPTSGVLLGFIMSVMSRYTMLNIDKEKLKTLEGATQYYHILTEVYKYAFSRRSLLEDPNDSSEVDKVLHNLTNTDLQDKDSYFNYVLDHLDKKKTHGVDYYNSDTFMEDNKGTAHMSIIDKYGNSASVTSTINIYFGAMILSKTGILLNDEMDDFSVPNVTNYFNVPPSPFNQIKPGQRPLSSMCPTIVVDNTNQKVKISVGAAGGTHIPTGIAQVLMRVLYFNESIEHAIDQKRIHHQLLPNEIAYEDKFNKDILQLLSSKYNHVVKRIENRKAIVTAVFSDGQHLMAAADSRKGGSVAGN